MYNENGDMVNTEKELADEITNFFRGMFKKEPKKGTTKEFPPCSMKTPFTEEISIATKKLRNGENPDIDSMNAEYIIYAPGKTHQIIDDVLRKSVETDYYLEILKEGILTPLQKSPKKTKKREKKINNLRHPSIVILFPSVRINFCNMCNRTNMGKIE